MELILPDNKLPESAQSETMKGVTIEEGFWIGAKAIILDGVCIGRNGVVVADSVVTRNFQYTKVVVGIPAKGLMTIDDRPKNQLPI